MISSKHSLSDYQLNEIVILLTDPQTSWTQIQNNYKTLKWAQPVNQKPQDQPDM
jgi:hypothetical protein